LSEKIREVNEEERVVQVVKAEVYSRVVGYYRPIQDWNEGKREEFRDRRDLTVNSARRIK
jgi:anaerobic ribonucleoside-triphosphate reductase